MKSRETQKRASLLLLGVCCLLMGLIMASQAIAAEQPPYEFSQQFSLTGDCSTSKADAVPDPGCPEKHPPERFVRPPAIAEDAHGFEYVASYGEKEGADGRIDIFSPKGVFVTELADPFGPKSLTVDSQGNLYVWEQVPGGGSEIALYAPTVYKPGEGLIEYKGSRQVIATRPNFGTGGLAINALNDHLLATAEKEEIAEFSSAQEGNKLITTISNESLLSNNFLAVDAQRQRLFASSCPNGKVTECGIVVLDTETHELLQIIEGPHPPEAKFQSSKGWLSVAVNEETGEFFVADLELSNKVYQFNNGYELLSTLSIPSTVFPSKGSGLPLQIALSNSPKGTISRHYLFVPSPEKRALAFSPPEELPPVIKFIFPFGIGEEEAGLGALIEPNGGATEYSFQYITQQAYEEAGSTFNGAPVVEEGIIPPNEQEAEVSAAVRNLKPNTAYRFRVFAKNNVGKAEKEASFTTYSNAPIAGHCDNQELRTSYSELLPDCRAFELVTPVDTNGRPPKGIGFVGDRFPTSEAAPSGDALSFLTEGGIIPGLGGTGSFNGDPYHTARTKTGWQTSSAGPTGEETSSVNPGGVSPDQGFLFWVATREGSAVVEGEATHYVRYPDGHSELIGRGEVEGEERTDPAALGRLITEDGTHIVFETRAINKHQPQQLTDEAPPTGTTAVYDRTADEVTHVVSLLPGEEGTPKAGENAKYLGASADGKGIAFTIGGVLYLRVNDAITYEIGSGLTFAGVAEEGRRIFYLQGGDLRAFDVASEAVIDFTTTGNAVPVNVSPDGSRAYFASTTAIGGSGENPQGAAALAPAKGTGTLASGSQSVTGVSESEGSFAPGMTISGTGIPAGTTITAVDEAAHTLTLSQKATASGAQALSAIAWNLYLSEEGEVIRFVGTVSERDVKGEKQANSGQVDGLGLWVPALTEGRLAIDPSRVDPDGRVLLFSSRADLTGYAHEGVPEIYRYDSSGETLDCISCIPTKTPASGGGSLESYRAEQLDPQPFSSFGFVQNLRPEGDRVIFQSTEPLVSRDNDGVQDVYEWEEQNVGSCNRAAGCVYLISSGQSAADNYLYGVSVSGDNVFFTTSDVLVGGDDSTVSIYDARVNGGFPEAIEEECQAEACRPGSSPPPATAKSESGARPESGNLKPLHCPKGKRKVMRHGKEVCVKKHHRKKHHKKGHAKKKGAGK